MAACDSCGTTILFGGVKKGDWRFCRAECAANSELCRAAESIPEEILLREVESVRAGDCPRCGGPGPIDVHTSHRVYSLVAFTTWSSHPEICCRPCGRKQQLKHGAVSMLLGWWGFPFGVLITPVQLVRNVAGLAGWGHSDDGTPSPALTRAIRRSMASRRANL